MRSYEILRDGKTFNVSIYATMRTMRRGINTLVRNMEWEPFDIDDAGAFTLTYQEGGSDRVEVFFALEQMDSEEVSHEMSHVYQSFFPSKLRTIGRYSTYNAKSFSAREHMAYFIGWTTARVMEIKDATE